MIASSLRLFVDGLLLTAPLILPVEKTKNLLFNGAKAVMGKIWTGEERSGEQRSAGKDETPACQTLLRGQTLIGHDGRLMRGNSAQGGSQPIFKWFIWIRCLYFLGKVPTGPSVLSL